MTFHLTFPLHQPNPRHHKETAAQSACGHCPRFPSSHIMNALSRSVPRRLDFAHRPSARVCASSSASPSESGFARTPLHDTVNAAFPQRPERATVPLCQCIQRRQGRALSVVGVTDNVPVCRCAGDCEGGGGAGREVVVVVVWLVGHTTTSTWPTQPTGRASTQQTSNNGRRHSHPLTPTHTHSLTQPHSRSLTHSLTVAH